MQHHSTAGNVGAVIDAGCATVKVSILNKSLRLNARLPWLLIVQNKAVWAWLGNGSSQIDCLVRLGWIVQMQQKWFLSIAKMTVRRLLNSTVSVCFRFCFDLEQSVSLKMLNGDNVLYFTFIPSAVGGKDNCTHFPSLMTHSNLGFTKSKDHFDPKGTTAMECTFKSRSSIGCSPVNANFNLYDSSFSRSSSAICPSWWMNICRHTNEYGQAVSVLCVSIDTFLSVFNNSMSSSIDWFWLAYDSLALRGTFHSLAHWRQTLDCCFWFLVLPEVC